MQKFMLKFAKTLRKMLSIFKRFLTIYWDNFYFIGDNSCKWCVANDIYTYIITFCRRLIVHCNRKTSSE